MDEIKTPPTQSEAQVDEDRADQAGQEPMIRSEKDLKAFLTADVLAECTTLGKFILRSYENESVNSEDIIQLAVAKMFDHVRCGNSISNVRAYFGEIVKNEALKALKHAEVRIRHLDTVRYLEENRQEEILPDAEVSDREIQEAITSFISRLPKREREVAQRRLQGETIKQIADALHIKETAVLRAWQRAEEKLKEFAKNLGGAGLILLSVLANIVARGKTAEAAPPPGTILGIPKVIIKALAIMALVGSAVVLVAREKAHREERASARASSDGDSNTMPAHPSPVSAPTSRSPEQGLEARTDATPSLTVRAGATPQARRHVPAPNVDMPHGVEMEQLFDRPAALVYTGITGVGVNDPPWLSFHPAQSGDGPLVVASVVRNPENALEDCNGVRRGPFIMIECAMPAGPARPVNAATRELLIGWVNGDQFVGNAWRGVDGGLMMADAWSLRGMNSQQDCDRVYWWGGLPVREVIHYVCEVARMIVTCALPIGSVSYTPDATIRPVRIWADFSLDEGWNPLIHIRSRHGGAWTVAANGRTNFSALVDPEVVWDDHLVAQAPHGIIIGLRTRSTTATIPGSRPIAARCE